MVALIIYFIVGALIMYFVKGARGVEIIPNLGFWKALPFLIKVVFLSCDCHVIHIIGWLYVYYQSLL